MIRQIKQHIIFITADIYHQFMKIIQINSAYACRRTNKIIKLFKTICVHGSTCVQPIPDIIHTVNMTAALTITESCYYNCNHHVYSHDRQINQGSIMVLQLCVIINYDCNQHNV